MRAVTESAIVEKLEMALWSSGDPERAVHEKAYLKSPVDHYGVTVPTIRKTVAGIDREFGPLSRRTLLSSVGRLWGGSVHEQRMAAVFLLERNKELLERGDLTLLERMIRDSFTWAYVDNLAATVAGSIVERYPDIAGELDRWADDDCFWVRRAALLALLGPLRRGRGDWRRFKRYADAMLGEKEFFVRKAIGWVLREASKERPDQVRKYVASRLDRMSGVTFREAVRRLPEVDRERLTELYRKGPR